MDELIYALRAKLQRNTVKNEFIDGVFSPREAASNDAIVLAETQMGFTICPLLKRIYTEVANGGFGPGSGIIGVGNGFTDDWGHNLEELYEYFSLRKHYDVSWRWPQGLLPFCHWGYTTYSCVDCNQPHYPVLIIDPDYKAQDDDMEEMIIEHKDSIVEWFYDWLGGKDLWADAFAP
ncbi:MAG: SMI1/KNR4 family protein [Gammaproteobacteria bacterium]|nr:SMI1/KNR4 family protein [Gammaproteobacteria bacterium]